MSDMNIEGLDSLLKKLDQLGVDSSAAIKSGVDQGTRRVKRDAKLLCPVNKIEDGGRLRNSIQHKTTGSRGSAEGIVSTNVEYAAYVEFGTGQRGESARIDRPPGISYRFDWAGMDPQPFLYPALKQNKDKITAQIEKSILKAIKEVAR